MENPLTYNIIKSSGLSAIESAVFRAASKDLFGKLRAADLISNLLATFESVYGFSMRIRRTVAILANGNFVLDVQQHTCAVVR